jgi:monoamine oxidase
VKAKEAIGSTPDAAVVGADLAGLAAARELEAAGAWVLEATHRVGGRTATRLAGGVPVEMDGQWIGLGQLRISDRTEDLGVETFPTYTGGRTVFYGGCRRSGYEEGGEIPSEDLGALRSPSVLRPGAARNGGTHLLDRVHGRPAASGQRATREALSDLAPGFGPERVSNAENLLESRLA